MAALVSHFWVIVRFRVVSQCDDNMKSDGWNDSTPVVLLKNERNGSMSTLIDTSSNER